MAAKHTETWVTAVSKHRGTWVTAVSKPPVSLRCLSAGGGAYKYADLFRDQLGVVLERVRYTVCTVCRASMVLR